MTKKKSTRPKKATQQENGDRISIKGNHNVGKVSSADIDGDFVMGNKKEFHTHYHKAPLSSISSKIFTPPPQKESIYFLGRESELNELNELLTIQHQAILVTGIGGVGKTELCRCYWWQQYAHYTHLGWIDYLGGSLRQSLLQQVRGVPPMKSESEEDHFNRIMAFLSGLDVKTLLIVDNIDNPDDPDILLLRKLPFKVIASSRLDLSQFLKIYELDFLSLDNCQALFMKHYQGETDEQALKAVITMSGHHTLALELLARTADYADLTISELLSKLVDIGFNLNDHITEVIETNWGDKPTERRFFDHIEKVFDLSNVTEAESYILSNLSVLPAIYIERGYISMCLGLKDNNALRTLVKKGWLRQRGRTVICHRIIQEVLRHRLAPDIAICHHLIEHLNWKLAEETPDKSDDMDRYLLLTQSVLEYFDISHSVIQELAKRAADIYAELSYFEKAISFLLPILEFKLAELTPVPMDQETQLKRMFDSFMQEKPWNLVPADEDVFNLSIRITTLYQRQGKLRQSNQIIDNLIAFIEPRYGIGHPIVYLTLFTKTATVAGMLNPQKLRELEKKMQVALATRAGISVGFKIAVKEYLSKFDFENPQFDLLLVANIQRIVGLYDEAEHLLLKLLQVKELQSGPEHLDLIETLSALVELHISRKNYPNAESLLYRILKIQETRLGTMHSEVLETLNKQVDLCITQKRYDDVEPLYCRILETQESQLGADHPDLIGLLERMETNLEVQEKYREAETLLRRIMCIREVTLGAKHPQVIESQKKIAALLSEQDKNAEAAVIYRKILEIRESQLGPDHPGLTEDLKNLAASLAAQKKYHEAEVTYHRALEIYETHTGSDSIFAASILTSLGHILKSQKRYTEALNHYRRALGIWESQTANSVIVANLLECIALILDIQENYDEAIPYYRRALEIFESQFDAEDTVVVECTKHLLTSLLNLGKFREATSLIMSKLTTWKSIPDLEQPVLSEIVEIMAIFLGKLKEKAGLLKTLGKDSAAETLYRSILKILELHLAPDDLGLVETLKDLAASLAAQEKHFEAVEFLRRAISIYEANEVSVDPVLIECIGLLIVSLLPLREFEEATFLVRQILSIQESKLGSQHLDLVDYLQLLANLLLIQGKATDAKVLLQRVLNIRESHYAMDTTLVFLSLFDLIAVLLSLRHFYEAYPLVNRVLMFEIPSKEESQEKFVTFSERFCELGESLLLCGDKEQAKQILKRGLYILDTRFSHNDPEIINLRKKIENFLVCC